jgi:NAD(P)-dependent dehydrogenase (short-subunit alcohol dehydrogenase family)
MTLSINLTNRRALVTGVSSGIGAGIALALAQAGADVAGCALEPPDHSGPQAFVAQAAALGRRAVYLQADVANAAQARSFVDWAAGELGGLDYVISNAGRNIFAGAEPCDEATWQANIDLNLAAHWRVAQAARPYLLQAEQPVIVVIASNHAWRTTPGAFPYNVAKAGMTALVQSLTLEWGPQIRTVGVAPGFINTPLADDWFAMFPDPAAKRASIEGIHPVGRLGSPADIGAFCAFLCSPLAGYIAGTTLLIDGGRSAVMQDV